MTIRETLLAAVARLEAGGIDTPRLDAEILLGAALGRDRGQLIAGGGDPMPEGTRFEALLERRLAREPVAYILGFKGFRHLDLHVDQRVLVPRPETELLVDAALELPPGARVVDIGTGSGAIALALKHERPDLDVLATEISEDAAAVARENAERLGLDVPVFVGDLMDPVEGAVDAVLANPPYVRDSEALQYEITWHEPDVALYGGEDGLGVYRRLVPQIAASAAEFTALEVGQGMGADVAALLGESFETELVPDLAGLERVVVGRR